MKADLPNPYTSPPLIPKDLLPAEVGRLPADISADPAADAGWRRVATTRSLPEVNATIPVAGSGFWRKMWAFSGPGLLVSVGYMDPGNWATDLEGGSRFGYTLLSVILISNFMAILLQHLSLKLGIVSGRDLAQACRDHYSRPVSFILWVLCEIAIAACDLAEVLGSAVALKLLFGLPLVVGVIITALDVLLILFLQNRGFRYVECLVAALIAVIGGCFIYEIIASRPDYFGIAAGLLPRVEIVTNPAKLYIAIGILGATVMPHNLYLHSAIVQTRAYERNESGKRMAIRFATIDSSVSLMLAFFVNAAILILAAASFYGVTKEPVTEINDAYKLLTRALGTLAGPLFALALLASGQNSTLTGTLAGQIVMEGFLHLRLRPWVRRLLTRSLAIIPAAIVAGIYGSDGVQRLLVLSQVILSMQLSFAVVPLVMFTSDRIKMGVFANGTILKWVAWSVTAIIIGLNVYLLWMQFGKWLTGQG